MDESALLIRLVPDYFLAHAHTHLCTNLNCSNCIFSYYYRVIVLSSPLKFTVEKYLYFYHDIKLTILPITINTVMFIFIITNK